MIPYRQLPRRLGLVIAVMALIRPAFGQAITADLGVAAGISAQIGQASEQIARMSELVGAAKEQLQTLQKVSDGIRNLQNVVQGGVQGLMGDAADKLGLKDVFMVGKQLQATATDGIQLYNDVRALPDEAKRQLKGIGVAVDDLQKYLADGVVYDVFQGMAVDDWKQVVQHPMDALAQGALGRAVDRTSAYANTDELRRQYAEELAKMTPEERAATSGSLGVDMTFLNFANWSNEMEKRAKKTIDFSILAEKMTEAAAGKGKDGPTVVEAQAALNASTIANMKLQIESADQRNKAADITNQQLMSQSILERDRSDRESVRDATAASLAGPE
jgi:hypothetical protein